LVSKYVASWYIYRMYLAVFATFAAKSAGLPFLEPYLKYQNATSFLSHGVNFAVGGSTVLSTKFLAEKNISNDHVKSPLHVQLEWLDKYLQGYCHDAKGYYHIHTSHLSYKIRSWQCNFYMFLPKGI